MAKRKYVDISKRHALKRAFERYEVKLIDSDLNSIARKIRIGDALFVDHLTNSRAVHAVNHKGLSFVVVYSKKSKRILTFLPKTAVELNGKDLELIDYSYTES